jgi:hypothetical protein
MRSTRITIQKNLARNNNGSRNNKPNPNPHIMEILSFSLAAFGGDIGEERGDPLLHLPDARPRTPPRGLARPLGTPSELPLLRFIL